MRLVWTVPIALCVMLLPSVASAQCEAVAVIPDGRIHPIDPTGTDKYGWFYLNLGRSYSVEVSPGDGVTGATPFPVIVSETANCPTSTNAPNASNTATVEPRMNQGSRWSFIGTNPTLVAVRVHVAGVPYKVSVSETTLFNSSWSTSGGFATQWGLQNTTGNTITGTLTVKESVGGSASYTRSVSLPANSTTFITTYDQFGGSTIPSGRGGSATFAHLGPPGSVLGDAYLVGASQIIPALFAPMRESAH